MIANKVLHQPSMGKRSTLTTQNASAVTPSFPSTARAGLLVLGITIVGLLSLGSASQANAFGVSGGGGKVGYLSADGDNSGVMFGAHIEMESPGSRFHLRPNALYWNGNGANGFTAALDGLYHFGSAVSTVPYLGAGGGFTIVDTAGNGSSSTAPALNLFGGVQFPAARNLMFLELRHTVSDVSQSSIGFGVTFR